MKDYAKWFRDGTISLEYLMSHIIADATRKERRRAARIAARALTTVGYSINDIPKLILGTTKGGKKS